MKRLATGGAIDRSQPLNFRFDGVDYTGFVGDTLASALLANDVALVARSPYDDRPRGVFSAGAEEPNALVQLGEHPLAVAPCVALEAGLTATSCAGRGRVTDAPLIGRYDKRHAHCDVLVVGAGPAGLAAALQAVRDGARVILADERPELGGGLLGAPQPVDDLPSAAWVAQAADELARAPDALVLTHTTIFGAYDHGSFMAAQRWHAEHGRLWQIRAERSLLATGALERPLVFAGNDLPGVMLASAVRTYLHRYAVVPHGPTVVFATHDGAYALAAELADAGVTVAAVVDPRPAAASPSAAQPLFDRGIQLLGAHVVTAGLGRERLEQVRVAALTADGAVGDVASDLACEVLAVSGGFDPALALYCQAGGQLRYDEALACFVAAPANGGPIPVGAAGGDLRWETAGGPVRALWTVPALDGDLSTHYVDLQRDVTVADIHTAVGAGLASMQHIKRHTTLGTGADQGATANVLGTAIAAATLGRPLHALRPTTMRPPYRPVSFELIAGRNRGVLHDPVRVTPMHAWHLERGTVFEDVGQWKRPRYFPVGEETMDDAVLRECHATRTSVGMQDVSTLGKIELQGPDAATFLNRLYTNRFDTLEPGFARYGLQCKADGMVFDDGVVMRLEADRFVATTTTGNAAAVMDWMEEWLQTEWPELRVRCTSVTEQWATVAVVGPRSRDVLARLTDLDVGRDAFPFMAIREGTVAGLPARVVRVSFSGELAFEVNVAAWHGLALWQAVLAAGEPEAITPYGTESMHVLRAEKGYPIIGQETDGTVTPIDLGMEWIVSRKKGDFVGLRSLRREDTLRPDRKQLVGLLPVDSELLPEGAQLVDDPDASIPMRMVGHVTSSYRSAALGRPFALALLEGGRERMGGIVYAPLVDGVIAAEVTDSVLYDPEGARRDG